MEFLLLGLILAAGFSACRLHPRYSKYVRSYGSQYLYLRSAELGVLCFAWAVGIILVLMLFIANNWIPDMFIFYYQRFKNIVIHVGMPEDSALRLAGLALLTPVMFVAALIIKSYAGLMLRLKYGVLVPSGELALSGELATLNEVFPGTCGHVLMQSLLYRDFFITVVDKFGNVFLAKVIEILAKNNEKAVDKVVMTILYSGYKHKKSNKIKYHTPSKPDTELDDGECIAIIAFDDIVSICKYAH